MESNHRDGPAGHKKHLWHVGMSKLKKHRNKTQRRYTYVGLFCGWLV